ncbi:MAG: NAD(P)H-hydrate dehydratase, partial [Chitinophagales bacterium]
KSVMKIFNIEQIRAADKYTIQHEPITSTDLMERASRAFVEWFVERFTYDFSDAIHLFCGVGNNGGDGLCIARMLNHLLFDVKVYIVRFSDKSSNDFQINERRLKEVENIPVKNLYDVSDFPTFNENDLIVDAIFGSGLSRPIEGFTAEIIRKINESYIPVIAVDIPSGLYADRQSDSIAIKANHTVSFQFPKLAFLLPQNHQYVGEWHCVDIRLHPTFIAQTSTPYHYIEATDIAAILRPKSKFSHKGTSGHALIIGGSYGKIGAAVLTSKATLKAGAGLVTVYVPKCGYTIMQVSIPEVMCLTDKNESHISELPLIEANSASSSKKTKYQAIAIGPGLGQNSSTQNALLQLLQSAQQPLVLDADALNIIAQNQWLQYMPKDSILTPHPKEFERLAGKTANHFERLEKQRAMAQKYGIVVLVKGAHTSIACPEGTIFFNSTGNPAMGTAGSGDVLTGMIASFVAQGYSSKDAAILGVYLHGLAGDKATSAKGNILASDLIEFFSCGL